jgi:23S rRNA (adenine2503-C2)-methyltransferase
MRSGSDKAVTRLGGYAVRREDASPTANRLTANRLSQTNTLTPSRPHAPTPTFGMTLAEYAAARGTHPQALRHEYLQLMRHSMHLELPKITRCVEQDGVIKFCLPAGDQRAAPLETESVIIPMRSYRCTDWHTLCVSSQVGCRMACTFCETGRTGWLRNLTAAEIVAQFLVARTLMRARDSHLGTREALADSPSSSCEIRFTSPESRGRPYRYFGDSIQNLVFMGMGEPFDNFDNLVQAIRVFNEPNGLAFPLSQITVSTVGRIDGLRRLAELVRAEQRAGRGPGWSNLRLAISLNAPNDAVRDALMPLNRSMPLAVLQQALLDYPLGRKGRYLIEYVMMAGVNDAPEHADQVAAWCQPLPCILNLIPYNPQRNAPYAAPSEPVIHRFLRRVRSRGIFVKRRITYGRDLMGACGQLGGRAVLSPGS